MAEEVIKKKGRLAAAVLAGSSLAFGSFALSMPAALAAEAEEPPTEEVTEPADLDTQDDASAADGDEGTDSDNESETPEEPDTPTASENSAEPSAEPSKSETPDPVPTLQAQRNLLQQVETAISLNSTEGPAGTTVEVTGQGFGAGSQVSLTLESEELEYSAQLATAPIDDEGAFRSEVTIPAGAEAGTYTIVATDDAETSETATFTVEDPDSNDGDERDITLAINPESLSEEEFLEDGVALTVEGLDADEAVNFEFGTPYSPISSLDAEATADADGVAEHTVVPVDDDIYVGDYGVTVTLVESGDEVATGSFEVTSELPQVSATPQNPTADGSVLPGEMLSVTGYNATPNSTVTVDYGIDGLEDEEIDTEVDGQFGTEIQVPEDTEPGVKELTLTDGDNVGTTTYTVAEISDGEPIFEADRDEIPLSEFVGDPNDRAGVFFYVEGLEGGTQINYNVQAPGNVEDLDGEDRIGANGTAGWWIAGPETDDPTVYLGDYSVTLTYEDEDGETQTLGPVEFSVVADGPVINLETDEVSPGGSLNMEVSNLSPEGDVTVEWNPTEVMIADADGNLEAELPIAADTEPGVYELTVTDEESGESSSVDYTVVDEPALTIAPETITLDDFIGDPEDGAGVTHVVENLEPGSEVTTFVTGPEGVNDYEDTELVDDEGRVEFVIYGFDVANPEVYLGEYNSVVTYVNEDGNAVDLTGEFTVITGADDTAADATDDDADTAAPAGGAPADLNGTSLADTGASGAQLGLLAGALLLAGGAFLAYANRGRLFSRKH